MTTKLGLVSLAYEGETAAELADDATAAQVETALAPEFVSEYSREIMDFRREAIGEDVYSSGMDSLAKDAEGDRVARWIVNFLK